MGKNSKKSKELKSMKYSCQRRQIYEKLLFIALLAQRAGMAYHFLLLL
jgi:hypothetical protein